MAFGDGRPSQSPTPSLTYSCKCLNVFCHRSPTSLKTTQAPPQSDDFVSVFVGDDGIKIAHPQLTLRSRVHDQPTETGRTQTRYTALSCLICQSLVYRTNRAGTSDSEAKDGPLLPTDDWVEDEVLKSLSGWIDVHRSCLDETEIDRLQSSPSFSSVFSLLIPSTTTSPSPLPSDNDASSPPPTSPVSYLSHMRPIFSPPPFTPSHPVFVHLSSVASARSNQLRMEAESDLEQAVAAKVKEVESIEMELRRYVQALWVRYRESIQDTDQEPRPTTKSAARRRSVGMNGSTRAAIPGSLVTVTDFVPQSASRNIGTTRHTPRVSSLSASLASSGFHHPRAQESHKPSTNVDNQLPRVMSEPRLDQTASAFNPLPAKATTAVEPLGSPGTSVLNFPRTTNDTVNTAASFAYFLLEEEMQKREQQGAKGKKATVKHIAEPSGSQLEAKPEAAVPPNAQHTERAINDTQENRILPSGKGDSLSPRKKDRKVKFDVRPDVMTIASGAEPEKQDELSTQHNEIMFDLEDDVIADEASPLTKDVLSKPILAFIERPQPKPSKLRPSRNSAEEGLPLSYAALRPASLPHFKLPDPAPVSSTAPTATPIPPSQESAEAPVPFDEREAQLMKLVAADAPSHRGAWKRDTKAWEIFVKRQGSKDSSLSRRRRLMRDALDEEEPGSTGDQDSTGSEDDYSTNGVSALVGSLPITISNPSFRRKETLSLASYQPKTSLTDRPGILVPPLHIGSKHTAAASRRAAYAERDRARSIDPGAHDFSIAEDDSDESDPDDMAREGERGRRHAKKILQARSTLPEAGMWMSLAS